MQRQAASGTSRVKLLMVHSPESNCRKSPYSTITGLTGKDITPTRLFMTSADCRGVPTWAPRRTGNGSNRVIYHFSFGHLLSRGIAPKPRATIRKRLIPTDHGLRSFQKWPNEK